MKPDISQNNEMKTRTVQQEALELVKQILQLHKTSMEKKHHVDIFYNHFNVSWIAIYSDKV